MKLLWFMCGVMAGATTLSLSLAAVPFQGRVTDDTAIYQNLSELRVARQGDLNFDSDIAQLSKLEHRYHEKLPTLRSDQRLQGAMKRISQQKYRYNTHTRDARDHSRNQAARR
jgi:hypothetical protein